MIVDNGGGRIFEQLPIADMKGIDLERHWLTPQHLDVAAIARGYGIPCEPFGERTIAAALERPGPTVLVARVGGDA